MSRKDDPVFNVKFVQLVEHHPCLWNSTLPAYSKKEEILKAWQEVAAETRDSVRNCRERWRTIRSSFLRSLKLSRTTTGRGKRKYYLSKYLQFLIPYTKTRLKNGTTVVALRKTALAEEQPPTDTSTTMQAHSQSSQTPQSLPQPLSLPLLPMTRINHLSLPLVNHRNARSNAMDEDGQEDTKDSMMSDNAAMAEEDVIVSLQDSPQAQPRFPLAIAIKVEEGTTPSTGATTSTSNGALIEQKRACGIGGGSGFTGTTGGIPSSASTGGGCSGVGGSCIHPVQLPITSSNGLDAPPTQMQQSMQTSQSQAQQQAHLQQLQSNAATSSSSSTVDLKEFAEWIKSKNDHQRHCFMSTSTPDADQSFLNSLYPFLKQMTGKQNLRFRQKVVGLIDAVLDNAD